MVSQVNTLEMLRIKAKEFRMWGHWGLVLTIREGN
jgi:hypothetical protein